MKGSLVRESSSANATLLMLVWRRGFGGVVVEKAVDLQTLHVLEC